MQERAERDPQTVNRRWNGLSRWDALAAAIVLSDAVLLIVDPSSWAAFWFVMALTVVAWRATMFVRYRLHVSQKASADSEYRTRIYKSHLDSALAQLAGAEHQLRMTTHVLEVTRSALHAQYRDHRTRAGRDQLPDSASVDEGRDALQQAHDIVREWHAAAGDRNHTVLFDERCLLLALLEIAADTLEPEHEPQAPTITVSAIDGTITVGHDSAVDG